MLYSTYYKQLVPRVGGVSAHEVLATIHERSMDAHKCEYMHMGRARCSLPHKLAPRYQLKRTMGRLKIETRSKVVISWYQASQTLARLAHEQLYSHWEPLHLVNLILYSRRRLKMRIVDFHIISLHQDHWKSIYVQIHFNVNTRFAWHLWCACRACGGKNNACLCTTVSSKYELAVILSKIPLKRRASLRIDTKNKTKRAKLTNVEMIEILAAYGWEHLWTGGKSVTIKPALGHLIVHK